MTGSRSWVKCEELALSILLSAYHLIATGERTCWIDRFVPISDSGHLKLVIGGTSKLK
jgi:hypothetical protein